MLQGQELHTRKGQKKRRPRDSCVATVVGTLSAVLENQQCHCFALLNVGRWCHRPEGTDTQTTVLVTLLQVVFSMARNLGTQTLPARAP